MAEIINMPRLSDTMEEGTVAKWYKKVDQGKLKKNYMGRFYKNY